MKAAMGVPGYSRGGFVPKDSNKSRQAATVTGAKKRAKLTEAPSVIRKQKLSHTWATKDKEMMALEKALKPMLDSGQITATQYRDAMGFHASHIAKDVTSSPILGDVKNWKAKNLITDSGVINKYVQALGNRKSAPHTPAQIQKMARLTGLSESTVKKELKQLMQGQHPTTASGAKVLQQVAGMDSGYQAVGAKAVMKERLKGDFYSPNAMKARAYDPSFDAKVEEDVKRRTLKAEQDHAQRLGQKAKADEQVAKEESQAKQKTKRVNKKNTAAVEENTKETKKATKRVRKISTTEERLAAATEKVARAREAIANPNNRKRKFNKDEIAANNLLLYGNPKGPTGDQRQTRRDQAAELKAERVARAQERQAARATPKKPRRFGGLSGKIMAGSMAASMAGGMVGGDAGNLISGVGSAVFTASMFKDLFAGAGQKIAGTKIGMSATKAFAPMLEGLIKVGPKLLKFGGPIGLAIGAVELFTSVLLEDVRKRAEVDKAISDMLDTSKAKLDSLNSFFGTNAIESGIRRGKTISPDQTRKEASLTSQFIQSEEFKTNYADVASKLKGATSEQLSLALRSLAVDLVGSGIGEEQAQIIIDAIKNEAGKKDLVIEVKSLRLNTKAGQESFKQSIDEIVASMKNTNFASNEFKIGDFIKDPNWFKETFFVTIGSDLEGAKKNVAELGSFVNGLGGQLQNGIITVDQYKESWDAVTGAVNSLPEDIKADTWSAVIADLNPEMYDLVKNLKMVDQQLVAGALAFGLDIPMQVLAGLNSADVSVQNIARSILKLAQINAEENYAKVAKIKKQIKAQEKSVDALKDKEDAINKKYDERLDALDKIIAANDEISKQQQGQLDLADALTQGDVAGAAKAMQQMRQDNAAYALDQQTSALEQARTNELKPVQAAIKSGDTVTQNIQDSLNTTIENFNAYKDVDFSKLPGLESMPTAKEVAKILGIGGFAAGGRIRGKGTGTSDSIPAMLSNGEYVIRAKAAKALGVDTLDKMNHAEKFVQGGPVNIAKYAMGGLVGRYADGGFMNTAGYNSGQSKQKKSNEFSLPGDGRVFTYPRGVQVLNYQKNLLEIKRANKRIKENRFIDQMFLPGVRDMRDDLLVKTATFNTLHGPFWGGVKLPGLDYSGLKDKKPTDLDGRINELKNLADMALASEQLNALANDNSTLMQIARFASYVTPVVGTGQAALNAANSAGRGDMVGAGLNALGAVPIVGGAGKVTAKIGQKAGKSGLESFGNSVFGAYDSIFNKFIPKVIAAPFKFAGKGIKSLIGKGKKPEVSGQGMTEAERLFQTEIDKKAFMQERNAARESAAAAARLTRPLTGKSLDGKLKDFSVPGLFSRSGSAPGVTSLGMSLVNQTPFFLKSLGDQGSSLATGFQEFYLSHIAKRLGLKVPFLRLFPDMSNRRGSMVLGSRKLGDYQEVNHLNESLKRMPKAEASDLVDKMLTTGIRGFEEHAAFNAILENTDTHFGNVMFSPSTGNLIAIDTGRIAAVSGSRSHIKNGSAHATSLADKASQMMRKVQARIISDSGLSTPQVADRLGNLNIPHLREDIEFTDTYGYSLGQRSGSLSPTAQKIADLLKFDMSLPNLPTDFAKNESLTQKLGYVMKQSGLDPEIISGVGTETHQRMLENIFSNIKAILQNPENAVFKYANGGMVNKPKYFANGGMVGMYARGGDVVPSMLTPGEFVVNQPAVKKFGASNLQSINNGSFGSGKNVNVSNNGTNSADTVYNSYSVNINVSGASASPEAMAKVVLKEIKRVSSQGIKGV
jgi:hypothetical protein